MLNADVSCLTRKYGYWEVKDFLSLWPRMMPLQVQRDEASDVREAASGGGSDFLAQSRNSIHSLSIEFKDSTACATFTWASTLAVEGESSRGSIYDRASRLPAAVGTPIRSFFDGRVYKFGFNPSPGDYGDSA